MSFLSVGYSQAMVFLAAIFLVSCQTIPAENSNIGATESQQPDTAQQAEFARINTENAPNFLGPELAEFSFVRFHRYQQPLGFSLRYVDFRVTDATADIYFYPVIASTAEQSQRNIVIAQTKNGIQQIVQATEQGYWSSSSIGETRSFDVNDQFGTITTAELSKDNLELHSILVVTEYQQHHLKIRLSVKNNEANRSSDRIYAFLDAALREGLNSIAQEISPPQ